MSTNTSTTTYKRGGATAGNRGTYRGKSRGTKSSGFQPYRKTSSTPHYKKPNYNTKGNKNQGENTSGGNTPFQQAILKALQTSTGFDENKRMGLLLSNLEQNSVFMSCLSGFTFEMQDPRSQRSLALAIAFNFKDVAYIDLSGNNLTGLEQFQVFTKLDNLTLLNLANNKLESMGELQYLQGLPLVDIGLVGNGIFGSETPTAEDVILMRNIFPSLKYLSHCEIPQQLLKRCSTFPRIDPNGASLNAPHDTILEMVHRVYQYLDSKRNKLDEIFDKKAIFSFSFNLNQTTDNMPESKESKTALSSQFHHSRNIKALMDSNMRNSGSEAAEFFSQLSTNHTLRKKLEDIVTNTNIFGVDKIKEFFSQFPETKHNHSVLVADSLIYTCPSGSERLMITVHGQCHQTCPSTLINYSRSIDLVIISKPSTSTDIPFKIVSMQYHMRPYVSLNLQRFVADAMVQ